MSNALEGKPVTAVRSRQVPLDDEAHYETLCI